MTRLLILFALVVFALTAQSAPLSDHVPAGTSKPTSPIAISHRLASPPKVGQPVEVILSIGSNAEISDASLSFSADDPLAMIDPLDSIGLSTLSAGQAADVAITVLPLLDQTHYLNVTVRALIAGVEQTRSIVVPIRLPGSELRKTAGGTAGNNEERVRSFQAIETVL